MELQKFVKDFEAEFEETQPGTLTPETNFHDLEEWSSLQALTIIAMVDTKYNTRITGSDLENALTITDVYDLIKAKSNE